MKIIGFLKQRWLISFLGLLAIVLLIWFAGPFVAFAGRVPLESALARSATIAVVVIIWALLQLRAYWLAKRENSQILAGIVGDPSQESQPTEADSAEEVRAEDGRTIATGSAY